jgi:putative phosphoesterase
MCGKRIVGVISDTHGIFDPSVPNLFQGVDCILHAGDIGTLRVYQQLESLAPVTAVVGNMDDGHLFLNFASQKVLEIDGFRIWLLHVLGNPHQLPLHVRQELARIQPKVVVFGHSHQPFLEEIDSVLFFNPGSAGPKRFSLQRCLGFLEIEGGKVKGRIVEL